MILGRDHSYSSIWEASSRREVKPKVSRCKHDDPILVITTETDTVLVALSVRV
jgi:hypothetical protein